MVGHASVSKIAAQSRGDVAVSVLETYRRANASVYDLLRQVEDRRLDEKVHERKPWQIDRAAHIEAVCAWNALALQTLGDQFTDSSKHSSNGYVSAAIARQAIAFYTQVQSWLSRARQARENPYFRLDVSLPAEMPGWIETRHCTRSYLDALLAATRALRTQAHASLLVFEEESASDHSETALNGMHQIIASASADADYAESLYSPAAPMEVYRKVEYHLKQALDGYYKLGQMVAMPELADETALSPLTFAASPAEFVRRTIAPGNRRMPTRAFDTVIPVQYASFWGRFGAYMLDWLLCVVSGVLISQAIGSIWASPLVIFVLGWLYFAGFESSFLQATPGKIVLGYKVTDQTGLKVSFLQASGRFFAKYVSMAILCLGFLFIAFSGRKQALHDMMAHTLVIDSRKR